MIADFSLTSELKGNKLIINTTGYINNAGGEKIVKEFNKHNNVDKLILNLKESNVVNSIGISHLIEIIEILNDRNGKLIFTNLDPIVEKTFTIMGLFKYAERADSIESALEK